MAFESLSEFFRMGTHGVYVWSTYGISVLALVGLFFSTCRSNAQLRKQLKKRYQREQSR
ncbi:Heme exporter protein D (CcmD) [Marinomonas aquimarina]|uniref:Heme exporter protein D n=1 Tax=Marinomonas aquimarina TaxID=295068 RepID=A0A1A8T2E7_9GAMM|nr:heme exporter protein CcmD [Marinomonas aquimarina]SBS24833.1 Heme exporter protein D (CcmD) [Marinomonas aquimarina]